MGEAKSGRGTRFHGRVVQDEPRRCDAPGCKGLGEFRAPRDGPRASDAPADAWHWFCLDHVRAFNAAYNFFAGMSPEEIARAQMVHPSWERRTRPFATNAAAAGDIDDPMGVLRGRYGAQSFARATRPDGRPLSDADRKALSVLQLDEAASLADIRRRYTELVRRYHPDRNGGDRTHERRLQDVIGAYTHLKGAAAFAATA